MTIFYVQDETIDIFKELSWQYPEKVFEMNERSLIDSSTVVGFFVDIAPYLIPALASIAISRLREKNIVLKINDKTLELKNIKVDEKTIEKFIQLVIDEQNKPPKNIAKEDEVNE